MTEMDTTEVIRILSVCDDDSVRYSRELLLKQAGYEAESITSAALLRASLVKSFRLAIVCQSLESKQAVRVTEILRRYNPQIQVLQLGAVQWGLEHHYGLDYKILVDPGALLDAVKSMCDQINVAQLEGR